MPASGPAPRLARLSRFFQQFGGILVLLGICLVLSVGGAIAVGRAKRRHRARNDFVRKLLAPFELTETAFYQHPYFFGSIRGLAGWFRWACQRAHTGARNEQVLFLTCKLPGCRVRLHAAAGNVGDFASSGRVLGALGWHVTEDDFRIGKLRDVALDEQLSAFARLAPETRARWRELSRRGLGGVLHPRAEEALIGRGPALHLVGGDEAVQAQLELQTKLILEPKTTTPTSVAAFVDDSVALAQAIARDLASF